MKATLTSRLLLLMAAALAVTGCKRDDDDPPVVDFRLPEATGTNWTYSSTQSTQFSNHAVVSTVSTVASLSQPIQLANGRWALVLRKEDNYGQGLPIVVNETYYQNQGDGFFEAGYTVGDHRINFKTGNQPVQLNGVLYSSTHELIATLQGEAPVAKTQTQVLHNAPLPVLLYNRYERDQWAALYNPNGTVRVNKMVVAREMITTPAGAFNAVKLRLRYDLDGDGGWDPGVEGWQWFAPEGLVRSQYMADGVLVLDPVTNTQQPATVNDVLELVSWSPPRQVDGPGVND